MQKKKKKTAPVQHGMVEYTTKWAYENSFFFFHFLFFFFCLFSNPRELSKSGFLWATPTIRTQNIFIVNCIAYQNYKCLSDLLKWWLSPQHIDKNQHIKHFNIFINHHQHYIKPLRSVKTNSRPKRTDMSQSYTENNMMKFTLIVRSLFSCFLFWFSDSRYIRISFAFHLIFFLDVVFSFFMAQWHTSIEMMITFNECLFYHIRVLCSLHERMKKRNVHFQSRKNRK